MATAGEHEGLDITIEAPQQQATLQVINPGAAATVETTAVTVTPGKGEKGRDKSPLLSARGKAVARTLVEEIELEHRSQVQAATLPTVSHDDERIQLPDGPGFVEHRRRRVRRRPPPRPPEAANKLDRQADVATGTIGIGRGLGQRGRRAESPVLAKFDVFRPKPVLLRDSPIINLRVPWRQGSIQEGQVLLSENCSADVGLAQGQQVDQFLRADGPMQVKARNADLAEPHVNVQVEVRPPNQSKGRKGDVGNRWRGCGDKRTPEQLKAYWEGGNVQSPRCPLEIAQAMWQTPDSSALETSSIWLPLALTDTRRVATSESSCNITKGFLDEASRGSNTPISEHKRCEQLKSVVLSPSPPPVPLSPVAESEDEWGCR